PGGLQFDHSTATGDCLACHASGSFSSWTGGKLHLAGSATPSSCLPCHQGKRPTSTDGWVSSTWPSAPFAYASHGAGLDCATCHPGKRPAAAGGGVSRTWRSAPVDYASHGAGLDLATCHTGPGTGAWGGSQNWVGGNFGHSALSPAASTCITCHATQRPDLVL